MPTINKNIVKQWLISQEGLNDIIANTDPMDEKQLEPQSKDGNNYGRFESWFSLCNKINDMIVIPITGALYPSTYKYIAMAIEQAEQDNDVKKVVFDINSPGGAVSGLFDLCETIKACSKPTYTYTGSSLCSAAFGIGVSTNKIYATRDATIGSVGVLVEYQDWSEYTKKLGVKTTILTSKNAENKVLDLTTEKGKAVLQARIDKTEDFFVEHIATSRGVNTDTVLSEYGHGNVFFGEEAKEKGMIDVLVKNFDECISNINDSTEVGGEESIMSLEELKKKDPDAYAAMMKEATLSAKSDVETIKAQAQKEERERINAINGFEKLSAIDGVSEVLANAKNNGTSVKETKALAFDAILANYKAPVTQASKPDEDTKAEANKEVLEALAKEGVENTPNAPEPKAPSAKNDEFSDIEREANEIAAAIKEQKGMEA